MAIDEPLSEDRERQHLAPESFRAQLGGAIGDICSRFANAMGKIQNGEDHPYIKYFFHVLGLEEAFRGSTTTSSKVSLGEMLLSEARRLRKRVEPAARTLPAETLEVLPDQVDQTTSAVERGE